MRHIWFSTSHCSFEFSQRNKQLPIQTLSFKKLLEIENTEVKNTGWDNRRDVRLVVKIITFFYFQIMGFPPNRFEIKTFATKNFFTHVKNLLFGCYVIHHSHLMGEITGYAHCFCNLKIRENQNAIPVIAHNCLVLISFLW